MRPAVPLLIAILLLCSGASATPRTWTVRRGDSLTSIAKKAKVKVSELRQWNGLKNDTIRPGDKLHLRPNSATREYTVRKGDTVGRIAKQAGVPADVIVELNPGLDPKRLRRGQVILLPGNKASATRRSTRSAPCPSGVVKLQKHPYYRLRSKDARWATRQTANALRRGFDHLRATHRLAPAVHVHDASAREGGQLGHHRSHRDGRDVDISYYQRKCPKDGCPVRVVTPKQLDVRRQWTLIRYWLKRGDVDAVFIDHKLQRVLYEHARKRGASKKQLREWFQYPDPAGTRRGIIRHWESHRNHVHVRFRPAACPDGCCARR